MARKLLLDNRRGVFGLKATMPTRRKGVGIGKRKGASISKGLPTLGPSKKPKKQGRIGRLKI